MRNAHDARCHGLIVAEIAASVNSCFCAPLGSQICELQSCNACTCFQESGSKQPLACSGGYGSHLRDRVMQETFAVLQASASI
jgi:hypothetical protein